MDQADDLKAVVGKIEALVGKSGFIYTLSLILLRDLFFAPEEAADIDWHDHLSFQEITFLVGLLIKTEIDFAIPTQKDSEQWFDEVYLLFLELHKKHADRFFQQLSEDHAQKQTGETAEENYRRIFGAGNMITEPIFYSGSGAYDFQYLEFAIKKYQRDESWIRQNISIAVPQMVEVANQLKKLHEQKYNARLNVSPDDFPALCKAALSIFCFAADEIDHVGTGVASAFTSAFSLTPGTVNQKLALPGQYNALQSNPIIQFPNGQYFLPVGFNLSEAIYEGPFYWMNGDRSYCPEALRHRGEFAQNFTAQLLKGVFGDDNVFTEVEVSRGKGYTVTDIDVLAIAGNKAVIAQVKSKRLTELAKVGDEKKLAADFKAAVQDAYDQGLLSRRAVLDRTNKLLAGGKELHISESIDDAYILCVSVDHYPAVTHQVDVYLTRRDDDPFPIALSIFDLDLLTFYLKDPFEFLYYLRQRVSLSTYFKADTEMSLLGFHLKRKLFRTKGAHMEALDNSFAQLIDANFPVIRGSVPRTTAADKLYAKWKNEEFQKLVEQVKSTREPGFTDAIFFLYDLAGDAADNLIQTIKIVKKKTSDDGRFHDASLIYDENHSGITIISEPHSPDELRRKLASLSAMRKYKTKADVWLGLGCLAGSPNLVDAFVFSKSPWKPNAALEELVRKYLTGTGKMMAASGEKIGRNDPCPCGSGKKFKKCHGA